MQQRLLSGEFDSTVKDCEQYISQVYDECVQKVNEDTIHNPELGVWLPIPWEMSETRSKQLTIYSINSIIIAIFEL